MAEGL